MAYRKAIDDLVRHYGERYVGMEYFGARNKTSLETCLDEVGKCDLVLVIVGSSYGTISPDGKKSYTHREVERARQLNIPVLVFVQENPEFACTAEAEGRERFVRWLGPNNHARFTNEISLLTAVGAALYKFARSSDAEALPDSWREIVQRADRPADYDCLAVSAQNVDRIYAVDRIVSEYETRAGSAVIQPGGSGANTAVGLSRLGLRVAVAGIVGGGWDGPVLRMALHRERVRILFAPAGTFTEDTGTTMTFIDPEGHRSIFVEPGINERFAQAARDPRYMPKLLEVAEASRILHLTSFTQPSELNLQEMLMHRASAEAIISVTPGALYCRLGLSGLKPLLIRANVVTLYARQLDLLLEHEQVKCKGSSPTLREKLDRLFEWRLGQGSRQPLAVVIKNTEELQQPGDLKAAVGTEAIEQMVGTRGAMGAGSVIDSTGAGDATATGFLAAVIGERSVSEALDASYIVARSVSAKVGARPGLPTRAQFLRRWRDWLGESARWPAPSAPRN